MAGVEAYGAKCPCCSKAMVSKHETGVGWLEFDACPSCGFLNWTSHDVRGDGDQTDAGRSKVWEDILHHYHCENLPELRKFLGGDEVDLNEPTKFDYSGYSVEELNAKRVVEPSVILKDLVELSEGSSDPKPPF